MDRLLILGIGLAGALIITLIVPDWREWLFDSIAYIFSFEWFGDVGDFFVGMFDNLGEVSLIGICFGLSVVGFVYALRNYMLNPFLQHMTTGGAIFWGVVTYVGCGLLGYLVGKSLFDRD
jgi:hypothetical protein